MNNCFSTRHLATNDHPGTDLYLVQVMLKRGIEKVGILIVGIIEKNKPSPTAENVSLNLMKKQIWYHLDNHQLVIRRYSRQQRDAMMMTDQPSSWDKNPSTHPTVIASKLSPLEATPVSYPFSFNYIYPVNSSPLFAILTPIHILCQISL